MTAGADSLHSVLEEARAAGFLGPGPVEAHVRHAEGFAGAVETALGRTPVTFADLGTGGGVPGLVLALRWTQARGIFVDSNHRRTEALRRAVARVGVEDRIEVLEARAELVGAPGPYRERYEAVTARSFGEPAVTAEVAAGIVAVGGVLVVSEPPEPDAARWPVAALSELGFGAAEPVEHGGAHFAVVHKASETPPRYPRGVGRPGKRPLW